MKAFKNKSILITGGTGSFGETFLLKLLKDNVKEVRIFSRDEKKQEDLRLRIKNSKVKFFIGDTRNFDSIDIASRKVDYIFHAAALKQVPSCEFHPMEAIRTNILGSENVIKAAIKNKVKKLVALSTDKAVYPINAMGMTKGLMEKILIAYSRQLNKNETTLCITRYGNVMASRGSVIPLIVSQIKNNQPITITDPKMTRFLMSLDDSVDLVLEAFKHGSQGDIFVQKSPASTIFTLSNALIKIFNKKDNVKTKIIGTRHGEKLFETLVSREEMIRSKENKNYFRILCDNKDINYSSFVEKGEVKISKKIDYTSHNTKILNLNETIRLLKKNSYVKLNINNAK